MRIFFPVLILLLTTTISAMAQSGQPVEKTPSDFQWENRILIVIANQESDILVTEQVSNFEGSEEGFRDRDLITFFLFKNGASRLNEQPLHPTSAEDILEQFGSGQPDFRLLLIGKDGGVKLQKDSPVTVEDIFGLIDSMPMRQREMRQNTGE